MYELSIMWISCGVQRLEVLKTPFLIHIRTHIRIHSHSPNVRAYYEELKPNTGFTTCVCV